MGTSSSWDQDEWTASEGVVPTHAIYYMNGTEVGRDEVEFTEEEWIEFPGTEHVIEIIEGKAATCTEDGLTDGQICTVCDKVVVAQEVIKATGHTEKVINAKEATCTTEGYTGDTVCEVCEEVLEKGEAIEKTAHTYKDGKCTVCNAEDPDYVSNQTGDTNLIAPFAGTMLVSAAVLVLLKKKEELMK